jgi:small nuclear ribonucleoprotein (snRNP)-like protein
MQRVIGEARVPAVNVEGRLQELDEKMNLLDQEVSRLVRLIESRVTKSDTLAADAA